MHETRTVEVRTNLVLLSRISELTFNNSQFYRVRLLNQIDKRKIIPTLFGMKRGFPSHRRDFYIFEKPSSIGIVCDGNGVRTGRSNHCFLYFIQEPLIRYNRIKLLKKVTRSIEIYTITP